MSSFGDNCPLVLTPRQLSDLDPTEVSVLDASAAGAGRGGVNVESTVIRPYWGMIQYTPAHAGKQRVIVACEVKPWATLGSGHELFTLNAARLHE